MKEIPNEVEDWTLGAITDIIHDGFEESEKLEFKVDISAQSERIEKTVCAFANTQGGTLIFGIDDDRTKDLQSRLLGLNDSGQLKRKIVDKIKNIHPNIPLTCINFKSSNVKSSTAGRVFVILKILPSAIGPHQYKNIFYKRMSDGNEPMTFEEIKEQMISWRRNERMLTMLMSEAGVIDYQLTELKKFIEKKQISLALSTMEDYMELETFPFFLYNQAYLYDLEIHVNVMRVIESISKLKKMRSLYESGKAVTGDYLKKVMVQAGTKTIDEYIFKLMLDHVASISLNLENIEKKLNIRRIPMQFPS